MILTITVNPAIDVTYHLASLSVGDTNRVTTVHRQAGGKGINVSSVLTALGSATTALFPFAGTSGDELLTDLRRRGITAVGVPVEGRTRNTVAVVEPEGRTTNFSEPGPSIAPSSWTRLVTVAAHHSKDAAATVISGSLPSSVEPSGLAELIRTVKRSAPVAVDVSGDLLLTAAGSAADLLTPNIDELAQCFPHQDTVTAARSLISAGARAVLVTCGKDGLLHVTAERVVHQPSVGGVSGNTTGAGDAALAAFLSRFTSTKSLRRALAAAAAAGAAAVVEPSAGYIDPATYQRFVTTAQNLSHNDQR